MIGLNGGFVRGSKFGRIGTGSLSTKRIPKGWYKGKGVRPIGKLDKKSRFRIDRTKLLKFHVPDLTGFELKPYVSYNSPKVVCPPLKIPPEYFVTRQKAIQELKQEADLAHTHKYRMRRLISEAREKAGLEARQSIAMEVKNEYSKDGKEHFSWENSYTERILSDERGVMTKGSLMSAEMKAKAKLAREKRIERFKKVLAMREENKKKPNVFGKNKVRWGKRFAKPAKKGGAVAKFVGRYEKKEYKQYTKEEMKEGKLSFKNLAATSREVFKPEAEAEQLKDLPKKKRGSFKKQQRPAV